jgi:hypothetical protein
MGLMEMAMRRRRQAGGAATPSAKVQAILSGTTGIAWDFTDISTMWQEDTKTTPVSAALQPVGALRTKWGLTQYDLIQATAGNRPAWDGTRFIVPDGTDFLSFNGAMDLIRNTSAYYIALRHGGTDNNNAYLSISGGVAGTHRFLFSNNTGGVNVNTRRLDADANSARTSVDATVFTGGTVAFAQDLATDGVCGLYRNNTFIENLAAIGGTIGVGENTATARIVLLANMTQAFPATGSLGRGVIVPRAVTAGERADIQSWLVEV